MEQGIYWRGRFWIIAGADEGDEQDPPNTGNGTGQAGGNASQQNAGDGEKRFSQAELDAIVADRLKRANESAERKASRERQEAEERSAAEQGKFKELAEQRQTRIGELEPFETKATRYEAALKSLLDVQRKDLPAHITTLLDKLDPAEQLEWIAANQEALKPANEAGNGHQTTPGPNRTPRPMTEADHATQVDDVYQKMRQTGGIVRW